MQYLYLIKCQQFYKIGIANDVQSRLAQLSTGNPFKLDVLAVYGFDSAEIVERALHQKFSKQRIRGEWFEIGEEAEMNFRHICQVLGGEVQDAHQRLSEEMIEEAEEASEYFPTIHDVKRIIDNPDYRLEYRYGDKGLRGFTWRLRTGNKESPLYIGRRSPIFEEVRAMLPEHNIERENHE